MPDASGQIFLSAPVVGPEEKEALARVIDDAWFSMGPRAKAFEEAFAKEQGLAPGVAVSSGTAALHLCLAAMGLGPGDEVLVPALTFVATANAALFVGAKPVCLDIESLMEPHLSMARAEAALTPATKAVIIMPYGGYATDGAAWRQWADGHGLWLIEDACHAAGLSGAGSHGHAACFSFFSNKNLTSAEGGMIHFEDPQAQERARSLRNHGMTRLDMDPDKGNAFAYDITALGYNYRLDDLRAALGLVQLERLAANNRKRLRLSHLYRDLLAEHCPGTMVPFERDWPSAAHLMPVLLPQGRQRGKLMAALGDKGIQSSVHYPPLHRFSLYRHLYGDISLPLTESFCLRELSLPLHPGLSEADVQKVIMALKTALE
jgi:dTDP-4-amino-4,6-dideoxygalactose transaminase